jgi:hypothetical protein
MAIPKVVSDLLKKGMQTDKHFLLGSVKVDRDKRKVEIFLFPGDPLVKLGDSIEGVLPTIKEVVAQRSRTVEGVYNRMLLSGGAVIGFGKSWDDAQVAFLKRGSGAPTDSGYLTMPAGRMDDWMEAHCYQEMEEIVLFGTVGTTEVIFVPVRDVKMSEDYKSEVAGRFKKAAIKGGVPGAENRQVHFLPMVEVSVPNAWSIELFLDGERKEVMNNVLVAVDEPNHTLEYRQMVLFNITLGDKVFYLGKNAAAPEGILKGLCDGEGFGCDMCVISLASLKKYLKMVQDGDAELLRSMLLKSQSPGLDVTVSTMPGGGIFNRFSWNNRVKFPFTTTVTEFVKMMS